MIVPGEDVPDPECREADALVPQGRRAGSEGERAALGGEDEGPDLAPVDNRRQAARGGHTGDEQLILNGRRLDEFGPTVDQQQCAVSPRARRDVACGCRFHGQCAPCIAISHPNVLAQECL